MPRIAFAELVAITAAFMALNALAIDMMLPALGQIGDDLGAARDNDRQLHTHPSAPPQLLPCPAVQP